jgi:hypothetical protein
MDRIRHAVVALGVEREILEHVANLAWIIGLILRQDGLVRDVRLAARRTLEVVEFHDQHRCAL